MSGSIEQFVERYGLIAVFVGCVAEGETAALLAGFLAHQGTFGPATAWVAVFLGAFLGDVGFFVAGRRLGQIRFVQRVRGRNGFAQVLALAERHPAVFVIFNRYVYGTRLAGSIAVGMTALPVATFVALNALSSAIWASLFGAAGWFFGLGFESYLAREFVAQERLFIALGLGLASAAVGFLLWRRRSLNGRMRDRRGPGSAG